MREQIAENLQAIENILSCKETGPKFDKYRLELGTLITKNKKIIFEASPFEQMRQLNMLIQKARTHIQSKLKIEP